MPEQFLSTTRFIFVVIVALVAPLFLIPLVKFVGHTEVVEEIAKALAVLFLILKLPTARGKLFAGFTFGLLFGLSETMFYLTSIIQLGDIGVLWQRLMWTVPMHITTVLAMVVSALWWRWFLVFGFAGAVALHLLFNSLI